MLMRDNGSGNTVTERSGTPARMRRWAAMLDEECLNVRLSDYFRQRREGASDVQSEKREPNGSSKAG